MVCLSVSLLVVVVLGGHGRDGRHGALSLLGITLAKYYSVWPKSYPQTVLDNTKLGLNDDSCQKGFAAAQGGRPGESGAGSNQSPLSGRLHPKVQRPVRPCSSRS